MPRTRSIAESLGGGSSAAGAERRRGRLPLRSEVGEAIAFLDLRLQRFAFAGQPLVPSPGLSGCRPVADDAIELEVGLRKVIADRDERLVSQLGRRVGHAVPVVEASGVAALAVPDICAMRDRDVLCSERL